jgi:hypothetical protein
MSATSDKSFGFLPWIVILVSVIAILIVYIFATNF